MKEIEVGDIYCYTSKSIITPSEYKAKRRVSGVGIVVSNRYGIIRLVSVQSHNNGDKYRFMNGNCTYDYPEVNLTIYNESAFRDLNGLKNTKYTKMCSLGELTGFPSFTWNSLEYLKLMEKMYKGEDDWYIPSVGEIKLLLDNKDKVLETLKSIKNETLSYILENESNISIISSTQRSNEIMYGVHLDSSIEYHHKLSDVYGISFKKVNNNG